MERSTKQEKRERQKLPEASPALNQRLPKEDDSGFSGRLGRLLAGHAEEIGQGAYRLVRTHWLALVNFHLFIFIGGALVAPCLVYLDLEWASRIVFRFYGFFCHQEASRSFFIFGDQVAICSRCLSFYCSALAVGMWVGLKKPKALSFKSALVLCLPAMISVLLQSLGVRESTNLIRVTTGALLGTAASLYLFPRGQRAMERLKENQDIRLVRPDDLPRQAQTEDLYSGV